MYELKTISQDAAHGLSGPVSKRLPAGTHLPLVSVVVTAYNYEQFVRPTLESVAGQTYDNFECVVVDDCSTDGTLGAIEEFLADQRDSRFRLLRSEVNRGQLGAQIAGFRASNGAFVVFLDADDLLSPDSLEAHVAVHLNCEPISAMSCLDSATIDQDGYLLSAHHREVRPRLWEWFRPRAYSQTVEMLGHTVDCRIISPSVANTIVLLEQYFWTTQSFMMFRGDFLKLVLPESTEYFRICSDYYLVRMAHAFNTTIFVKWCGGAYRVHGSNHYTHRMVVSADQNSGDGIQFAWQPAELAKLAGPIISDRFELFAAIFGEFRVARALLALPRKARMSVFQLLRRRLRIGHATFFCAAAWTSCCLSRVRRSYSTFVRVIWSGA